MLAATSSSAAAALTTDDLADGSPTATELAQSLAGSGVTVSNATYTGAPVAAGTFAGGAGIIGFDDGVILSSGRVASVIGPNANRGVTTSNATPGDPDLDALVGGETQDAAVLAFDLVPTSNVLTFSYVFSSDEYNEFVAETGGFNDVFAFYVNGQNCALVPGTSDPVSINTINGGNPFGTIPSGTTDAPGEVAAKHPELYRNNDIDNGSPLDTEMDGLTTVLSCTAAVAPGEQNRVKLAIADRGDKGLDSNVFLQRSSFAAVVPKLAETVIGQVVSGDVSVRLPTGSRPRAAARVATEPPGGYVPLKGIEVLPVGTIVDARHGRLALTSAASELNGSTQTQRAEFYRGVFEVRQKRARLATTDIALRSPDFAKDCGQAAPAGRDAGTFDVFAARGRKRSKKVVSRLWGSGKGRFRTTGRHSAATVRGTIWLTEERCDGTLTRVTRGSVSVRDTTAHRTVTVRAGHSYLARAVRATVKTTGS